MGCIDNLLPKASAIIVGGAMAYTFLAALGHKIGTSRVETDKIADAKKTIDLAAKLKAELLLPIDHVCSTQFSENSGDIEVFEEHIKDGFMGLDIGPKTQTKYAMAIRKAKTIVWNGPMGVFEFPNFAAGTKVVAQALTEVSGISVVGGGDSAAAVRALGFADSAFGYISTGGGASLEYLEGKELPGLKALDL
jgi:phosphoglycerate kinase